MLATPYCCQDTNGGCTPIDAKREAVRTPPTFCEAYRRRRCIVPVDGFLGIWAPPISGLFYTGAPRRFSVNCRSARSLNERAEHKPQNEEGRAAV